MNRLAWTWLRLDLAPANICSVQYFVQSNYLDSVQFIGQYNYLYTLPLYHFNTLTLYHAKALKNGKFW